MAYPRQSIELSLQELTEVLKSFFSRPAESGEIVSHFESVLARFVEVRHAIAFGSQRGGMTAVLKTLGPREGDEVIVPAYTFFSVPACVVLAGFRPVFVDVDPETWNLDPSQVKRAITPETRAIVVSHLNGCPAELERLSQIARDSGITLIEDCAQALGAVYQSKRVGSFGVGCFSFGEGKNLLAMGGGMVTTQDPELAARLRETVKQYRTPRFTQILMKLARLLALKALTTPLPFTLTAYPWLVLESLKNGGVNRDNGHALDAMPENSLQETLVNTQAALALAQFSNLAKRNEKRLENAQGLSQALAGITAITLPPVFQDRTHLYLHYAFRMRDRDLFVRKMLQRGVDAQRDYCSFCPGLRDFKPDGSRSRSQLPFPTPVAESLDGTVAYLPTQPQLGKRDMERIAGAVRRVLMS